MHPALARLLHDYRAAVQQALGLMEKSGIALPASNQEWLASPVPEHGLLQGDIRYFKHGYGCSVQLPEGTVDFDFGAEGQTNGVSPGALLHYAGVKLSTYGFDSEADFMACFEQALAQGELHDSGYLLYY